MNILLFDDAYFIDILKLWLNRVISLSEMGL